MIVSSLAVHAGDPYLCAATVRQRSTNLRVHWLEMCLKEYTSLGPSHYCVHVTVLENPNEGPSNTMDTLIIH